MSKQGEIYKHPILVQNHWPKIQFGIFNRFKVVSIFQVPDRDVNSQRSVGSAAVDADQNPQIYGGLGGNKVVESPRWVAWVELSWNSSRSSFSFVDLHFVDLWVYHGLPWFTHKNFRCLRNLLLSQNCATGPSAAPWPHSLRKPGSLVNFHGHILIRWAPLQRLVKFWQRNRIENHDVEGKQEELINKHLRQNQWKWLVLAGWGCPEKPIVSWFILLLKPSWGEMVSRSAAHPKPPFYGKRLRARLSGSTSMAIQAHKGSDMIRRSVRSLLGWSLTILDIEQQGFSCWYPGVSGDFHWLPLAARQWPHPTLGSPSSSASKNPRAMVLVRTSHSTLPQPHVRPYSKRTARTLTFDPTLTKIRNPSGKKNNISRFTFDPTPLYPASNQTSVNQPPLNNHIHWYQINQPPLNNDIHCYQINQPPLNNYIHWYQINQPPLASSRSSVIIKVVTIIIIIIITIITVITVIMIIIIISITTIIIIIIMINIISGTLFSQLKTILSHIRPYPRMGVGSYAKPLG